MNPDRRQAGEIKALPSGKSMMDGRYATLDVTGKMECRTRGKKKEMTFKGMDRRLRHVKKFVGSWSITWARHHVSRHLRSATKTFTYTGEFEAIPA